MKKNARRNLTKRRRLKQQGNKNTRVAIGAAPAQNLSRPIQTERRAEAAGFMPYEIHPVLLDISIEHLGVFPYIGRRGRIQQQVSAPDVVVAEPGSFRELTDKLKAMSE